MMELHGNHVGEASLEITVIRADGTVEHLGIVDSYRRPWYRTLLRKVMPWRP